MKKIWGWISGMILSVLILICMAFPAMKNDNSRLAMAEFFKEPSVVNFGEMMTVYHNIIRFSQLALIIATILFLLFSIVVLLEHYSLLKMKLPMQLMTKIMSLVMLLSAVVSFVGCLLYLKNSSSQYHLRLGLASILTMILTLANSFIQWFAIKKTQPTLQEQ